jgi:hypothetical protein
LGKRRRNGREKGEKGEKVTDLFSRKMYDNFQKMWIKFLEFLIKFREKADFSKSCAIISNKSVFYPRFQHNPIFPKSLFKLRKEA